MPDVDADMAETKPFEDGAKQVLLQVRGAFAGIIGTLPGHVTRPHELSKTLKIDMNLAWKIVKVAYQADLFMIAKHIPGPAGIELFLNAAAKQEVASSWIEQARAAMREFQGLIDVHAGDRATLEKMLLSYAQEGRTEANLVQRRTAFESNSFLWGISAKAQLFTDIMHPSADPDRLDIVALRGLVGLRRIRPNVSWAIARAKVADDQGKLLPRSNREPLDEIEDAENGVGGTPFLREFCSKPLPRFHRVMCPDGFLEDDLVGGEVGNTGSTTCITGELIRSAASFRRSAGNCWAAACVLVRTPSEALVVDWFLHEDLFGPIEPELGIYSELNGRAMIPPLEGRERDRLPSWDTVEYLGKGLSAVHTPHVPRYASMIRCALEKQGWQETQFDVYRAQIQYPLIPTTVLIKHELRDTPAQ